MAKPIRDEIYYQKRIEETEIRRKRVSEEEKKIKAEYEEWKKTQVVSLLEKYSLTERISESTLWLFEKKFKEILEELNRGAGTKIESVIKEEEENNTNE